MVVRLLVEQDVAELAAINDVAALRAAVQVVVVGREIRRGDGEHVQLLTCERSVNEWRGFGIAADSNVGAAAAFLNVRNGWILLKKSP